MQALGLIETKGLLAAIEAADAMLAETAVRALVSLKVTELRALAREYPELGIGGREISKANKTLLLTEFKAFYDRTEQ